MKNLAGTSAKPRMPEAHTARRKDAHLDLCAQGDVEPDGNSTLLDCVHLVHNALPELALDEVELTLSLWGKVLRAPLLVTGMTGGTDRAREVNRDLAQVAERHGLAFGVGSQRAMAENPELARTFQVRDVAPHVLLIGNIGLKQAIAMGVDGVRRLVDGIDADGLALHLNAAQELSQPEGDRDFRGGYSLVQALASAFGRSAPFLLRTYRPGNPQRLHDRVHPARSRRRIPSSTGRGRNAGQTEADDPDTTGLLCRRAGCMTRSSVALPRAASASRSDPARQPTLEPRT